jgi:hypothetical protein
MTIMAATGKSKTCVWRWQERFMAEGVDGLLRDKTRPPGTAPSAAKIQQETAPAGIQHAEYDQTLTWVRIPR